MNQHTHLVLNLCAMTVLLTGCATQKLNEGLPYLIDKPVKYAVSYLGYPNAQQTIGGNDVYVWGVSETFTAMQTVSNPFSVSGYDYGGGYSYSGTTTSQVPQTYNYSCTIRLVVDKKEIVRMADWRGNEGGCSHYADAMDQLIRVSTFDVSKVVKDSHNISQKIALDSMKNIKPEDK
ncbi:MAG: hypothetical protein JNN09_04915 [Alphaproteobacteria bacterium]|nr:hypothetical protein [Alphaproteobacteria bacterium]